MSLSNDIRNNLPDGFVLSIEIVQMLDYIEANQSDSVFFQVDIQFGLVNKEALFYYFNNDEVVNDLGLLATTADGALLAIWKHAGQQYFIHLGSEGNDWLILAANPVDFIKVIAIGYDSFTKKEVIYPPTKTRIDESFQNWMKETFQTDIPLSGKDIVDLESSSLVNWIQSKMKF